MAVGLFRNSAGAFGGSATPNAPITVPRTSGQGSTGSAVQSTDLCTLFCFAGGGSNASVAPDGTWTTVKADTPINANGARFAIYRKVIGADTSIVPSYPTAPTSGNGTAALAVFHFGVTGHEVVGAVATTATATGIVSAPGITPTGPDRMALAVAFLKATSTTVPTTAVWSGGFTEIAEMMPTATLGCGISVAQIAVPTVSATAGQTCTWNLATLNQAGMQFALVPAAVPLTASMSISPPVSSTPAAITATITTSGGNGNTITYGPVDWRDGTTSAAQSSNVFTHTLDYGDSPAADGEFDILFTVSQA